VVRRVYTDGLPLSLTESPYFTTLGGSNTAKMPTQPRVMLSKVEEEEDNEGSSSGGDFGDED